MPRQCAIDSCASRGGRDIKLFRFPLHDINRLQVWIRVSNRGETWKPTQTSRLCSQHFPKLIFDSNKRLLSDPAQVISPKVKVVNLTYHRTPLALVNGANIMRNGGIQIGAPVPALVKSFTSVGSQTKSSTPASRNQTAKIKQLKQDKRLLRLKLAALSIKLKRKEKHCTALEDFLKRFWDKLENCLVLKSLVLRLFAPTKRFDGVLKSFSQTLHYYSVRGHAFVRSSLSNLIPNERIIRKWTENFKLQPGFIIPSFTHLQAQSSTSKSKMYCSLQFDEVHIREQVLSTGSSFEGFVDYAGFFTPKNPKTIASSALVLMAVGLNSSWKIPVAYFHTKGLPAKFLKALVPEALIRLDSSGIVCKAVVFDGLGSNISCMEKLGAKLNAESPQPWFVHPNGKEKVYVIFDVCQMIKLLRNLWNHFRVLHHHNKVFAWGYFDSLIKLQEAEGLRSGNKVTSRHSHFHLQKMKVKLATQVFSSSVSNSLLFCCEDLNLNKFKGCGPTAKFISTIDRAFDALNSMHPLAKSYKAPLSEKNRRFWEATFRNTEELLKNVKVDTKNGRVPVHKTKRKTAIVGFICSMRSISGLMSELVLCPNPPLQYLLTYRLSQDHIETFFSSIRNLLGRNTNPNVSQFRAALKKILTARILPNSKGNCVPQDDTEVSIISPLLKTPQYNSPDTHDTDVSIPDFNISSLSQYTSCVVTYIAGWVIRKLKPKMTCETCTAAMEDLRQNSRDYALINQKQNGGLINPSADVIKICKTVETAVRQEDVSPSFRRLKIQQEVLKSVLTNNIFESLTGHQFDSEAETNHIIELSKLITNEYLTLRMHHCAKIITLQNKPVTSRSHNTSLTHFDGV